MAPRVIRSRTGGGRAGRKKENRKEELEKRGDKEGKSRCDMLDNKREKTGISKLRSSRVEKQNRE
jgi:hypothetical protein